MTKSQRYKGGYTPFGVEFFRNTRWEFAEVANRPQRKCPRPERAFALCDFIAERAYAVTKAAAEDLCQLFHRSQGLACIVLRTSRFFPEEDDNKRVREAYL
jgi:nucleoside-diphosphate-sugar epimerase